MSVLVFGFAKTEVMANLTLFKGIRPIVQTIVRSRNVSESFISKRWCTAAHTLAVKQKIKETKEKALLGGGQRRIDKQHQKVLLNN